MSPSSPLHSAPDTEVVLPDTDMPMGDIDLNPGLDELGESDAEIGDSSAEVGDQRIRAWTAPFEDAYSGLKSAFMEKTAESVLPAQQSRFVLYTDAEILLIQRKFIRFQANPENAYPLETLLAEVERVIEFIWRSVNSSTALFGQEEYYLRILGDLEEWLEYYTLPADDVTFYVRFFSFFQLLDVHVSFLADGYLVDGHVTKMSGTEIVRLAPIVNRLRLLIISKIDAVRKEGDDILDLEIGRLFEGTLDRM